MANTELRRSSARMLIVDRERVERLARVATPQEQIEHDKLACGFVKERGDSDLQDRTRRRAACVGP